jgi:cation diffusion facilitator family transporter
MVSFMERYEKIKKASILGIVGNVFLLVIKAIVGFMTHSQSMIADASNSAGDIFSSLMTFIGNRISSRPRDKDHNLGHGKADYVYSMLISLVMMVMCYDVCKGAIKSLIVKGEYEFSFWLIVVCFTTIAVKFGLFLYTHYLSKKYNSILIEANAMDHRNDCIITTCNLIANICALNGIYFIDGIVGIGISVWIFITAVDIFKKSYDVLMDKSVSKETKEKVYRIINSHEEIKKVKHFNSTPVGYRYQVSFTIYVDGSMSTYDSHKIADDLEKEIAEKVEEIYLTVIHVNPIKLEKDIK